MIKILSKIKEVLLDSLFPYFCYVCGFEGEPICIKCLNGLKKQEKQFCLMCNKPAFFGATCELCKSKVSCDGLFSAFSYTDTKKLIIEGKYNFVSEVFRILGKQLALNLRTELPKNFENFCVSPIPLAGSRERWRGFNQSKILAEEIAKELRVPYRDLLSRPKQGKIQKDLDKKSRIKNMKDAFSIQPGVSLEGQCVILVDDVTTTGSTLKEATSVLKKYGSSQVWCVTLARD